MYIVIETRANGSKDYIGPFDGEGDAERWAKDNCSGPWEVIGLSSPNV